jgi:hypothetical protein
MAQYEAKLRSLARDMALPPSLVTPLCGKLGTQAETEWDDDAEAEDATIIAARLGGVERFD